jgi:AcrR family transcriptional regulator
MARPRRTRSTLTRDRVLAEARRLLQEEGVEALSMRALAARFHVSPMALYNHVRDKQDLIAGIVASVVRAIEIPPRQGGWQRRLRSCFRALRRACLSNPHVIPLIEQATALDPAIFRPMEAALGALKDAGMNLQDAMRAYFLLVNFTMGQVSYEIRGPNQLDAIMAVRRGAISRADFPLVVEATSAGAWDFDAAFEFGLDVVIGGLAQRLLRATRPRCS